MRLENLSQIAQVKAKQKNFKVTILAITWAVKKQNGKG
jgi:hypothetical protein